MNINEDSKETIVLFLFWKQRVMSELQTDANFDSLSEKLKELWVILYSKGKAIST